MGNDEFKHPVVKAVNEFRHRNINQPENLVFSENGKQIIVERGTRAAVVINLDEQPSQVAIPVTLSNGKYRDAVTRQRLQVKKGILKATLAPMTAYILYK